MGNAFDLSHLFFCFFNQFHKLDLIVNQYNTLLKNSIIMTSIPSIGCSRAVKYGFVVASLRLHTLFDKNSKIMILVPDIAFSCNFSFDTFYIQVLMCLLNLFWKEERLRWRYCALPQQSIDFQRCFTWFASQVVQLKCLILAVLNSPKCKGGGSDIEHPFTTMKSQDNSLHQPLLFIGLLFAADVRWKEQCVESTEMALSSL